MRWPLSIPTLACAIAVLSTGSVPSAAATDPARILVIYPETVQLPGIVDLDRGFRAGLAAGMPVPPRVYDEYLDSRRFPGIANDEELRRWFAHKYRNDRPDLIVSVTALPISLVARPGLEIWPGVPIVFVAVDHSELAYLQLPVASTGITFRWPVERTIALVRQLFPGVRRLIVPSGTDAFDREYHDVFRRAVRQNEGLEYVEWTDASIPQMRERLGHAPDDAAVFVTIINGDREIPSMTPLEVARTLASASSRPVFGMVRTNLGTGMVGGWLLDPEVVGRRGGELAVRVLRGTPANKIPVELSEDIFRPVFDARALRRFGIQRSALPPAAEILYEEVSVFRRYRWQILSGLSLLALQSVLIAVLLEQRRRRVQAQERLDSRLHFEQLVSDVAATLSRTSRHDKQAFERVLEKIGHAFHADRVGVLQWWDDTPQVTVADVWRRTGLAAGVADSFDLPTVQQAARRGEVIRWNSRDDVPRDSPDLDAFDRAGAGAVLIVPIVESGPRACSMGVGRPSGRWTDEDVERVKALVEHFSAWVRRQWAEGEAETSNALNASLCASSASQAAVVDADGIISWVGGEPGTAVPPWLPRAGGVNILHALEARADHHDEAAQLLEAIRSVRANPSLDMTTESRFIVGTADRYCEMHIRRLDRSDGGLALTFRDVTANRMLELDNQARLHEIAHLDRVASLGALATSLAHELNQPLTAILANAQAAQVLLEQGSVAPNELSETLADIVDDDRRAGDIIYRMRRMLKKGDVHDETVDLNGISHDAIRLVAGRAAQHRVAIDAALSPDPVRVSGDTVQLQQVVVNLLLNAIDATAQRVDGARRVRIETGASDGEAHLAVRDTGMGVDPAELTRIFRPFFSTKQEGLGMGLSISRTIVEAHRGRIWAESAGEGAVFHIALARLREDAA